MDVKIVNGLTRLADPMGVVCPAVNGLGVLEARESVKVTVHVFFPEVTDLAIATEIIELGILETPDSLSTTTVEVGEGLKIIFLFSRSKVQGLPSEQISNVAKSLCSCKDRLKAEVLSSKIRLSADIRTAITHTSRVYASHSSAIIRGA